MGLLDRKQKAFEEMYNAIMNSHHLENIPTDVDKEHFEKAVIFCVNAIQAKYVDEKTYCLVSAAVEQNFILMSMLDEVLHQLHN